MFYCKTSTNYNKWDMFESDSEEEEEKEPVVPKDDPQFKAMEQDFKDRGQRRRRGAARVPETEKMAVLRRVWVLVRSVPGCKGHTCRLPTVCTVSIELAGLVVRLSKFTISPTTVCYLWDE